MSYNFRVMAVPHPTKGWDEVWLTINDVGYDNDGNLANYGQLNEAPMFRRGEVPSGETIEDIRLALKLMENALAKPILCAGDKWPQEYIP